MVPMILRPVQRPHPPSVTEPPSPRTRIGQGGNNVNIAIIRVAPDGSHDHDAIAPFAPHCGNQGELPLADGVGPHV